MASRGGIGRHHGCRPGAAEAHVVRVHGHSEAMNEMPAGDHAMEMPRLMRPEESMAHTARRDAVPDRHQTVVLAREAHHHGVTEGNWSRNRQTRHGTAVYARAL